MNCLRPKGDRLLVLIVLLLLFLSGASLQAQQKREAVLGMSQKVFKALEMAQAELDADNMAAARALIEDMLKARLSDYERAHGLNLLGYAWYQDEQLEQAREAYQQAVELEELPDSMRANLLVTLGQICLFADNHADAEGYLRRLLALPEHDTPINQVLLATALLGQERYDDTRILIENALEQERALGNLPKEQWLAMLSSVYYELSDYPAMRDTVAELATHYPREQYVMNLAALHGELGDRGRQLALVESMADNARIRNAAQAQMLANLFLEQELPYKAAVLLELKLDDGTLENTARTLELLSQAWYLAAEPKRAVSPLRRAAELSDDGELYMRLAHLHMESGDWLAADRAAELALEKGGLREEGHAWLLRGMAQVRLDRLAQADYLFNRASAFEHAQEHAKQWLNFVTSENQRAKALNSTIPPRDDSSTSGG